jgi:hypothetical protein
MSKKEEVEKYMLIKAVVSTIAPILRGLPPGIQSAALADLMAMWLAGHQGEKLEIDEFREGILQEWCKTVRDLVPLNEQAMFERMAEEATKQ